MRLVVGEGRLGTVPVGSQESLAAFLRFLHVNHEGAGPDGAQPRDARKHFDPRERQRRQVRQIENHVQALLRVSGKAREQFFLDRMPSGSSRDFAAAAREYRRLFWEDVIGKVTDPLLAPNPRTRRVYDRPEWTGYEVVLDVWADVFAWGVLLLPTDLQPGERRPVVVAQHGLEGVPSDVIEIEGSRNYDAYRAFAARLAERGFVVFAPHNPYRGRTRFAYSSVRRTG